MESAEIRQRFLDYFARNGHTVVPSASLILDDPTLLADGSPCNPTGVAQCRGFCLEAIDAQPSHGVCASLIDRTRGDACPDTPMSVLVRGPDLDGLRAKRIDNRDDNCRHEHQRNESPDPGHERISEE